jgi:molybdopterin molybdotransferase
MSEPRRVADWLEVRAALRRIVHAVEPVASEQVDLSNALTRVLAEAVISPIDQPPWDNSAMDGYAVRSDDVRGCDDAHPCTLQVIERVPAGGFPERSVGRGEATSIMTGAPIPRGADSVIRVEHTRAESAERVLIFNDMDAGRNLRFKGEDLRRGDIVLTAGRVLRAAEIGLLATVGAKTVRVMRRPVAAILSTGDELADLDDYEQVLSGRKIVNSNAHALAAAVAATGATANVLGIARDDADSLHEHIARAQGSDLLITTAGASVGDHDLVKDVLEAIGFELEFWRVRMRPGSPFSFGWLKLGEHRIPVFGLPGNPVSALVTFELLVRPALRRMLGRADVYTPTIRVRAADRIPSKSGLTHFLRVRLKREQNGEWLARLTGAQGSGLITSMAEADALLIVPEDREGIEAGEMAWAVRLLAADAGQESIGF